MKCTWKDCKEKGVYNQIDNNGDIWAILCVKHNQELENSIGDHPRKMLRAWVLAQGGADKAVERIIK